MRRWLPLVALFALLVVASLSSPAPAGTQITREQIKGGTVPTGTIAAYGGTSAPTSWLLCDGASVSRTTYSGLYAVLVTSQGTATMTIASPCVVTFTSHGRSTGDSVFFETTGALPTGVNADTTYYVKAINANTFNLCTTYANALSGTTINTSGTQSGTHTLFYAPYGVAASTTFKTPDLRGRMPIGSGTGTAGAAAYHPLGVTPLSAAGGEETHTLVTAEIPSHTHTYNEAINTLGNYLTGGAGSSALHTAQSQNSGSAGGGGAHNILGPHTGANFIIRQ